MASRVLLVGFLVVFLMVTEGSTQILDNVLYLVGGTSASNQEYINTIVNGQPPCENSTCTQTFTNNIQAAQRDGLFRFSPAFPPPPFHDCTFNYPPYDPSTGYFVQLQGNFCKWQTEALRVNGNDSILVNRTYNQYAINIVNGAFICSYSPYDVLKSILDIGGVVSLQCEASKITTFTFSPEFLNLVTYCFNLNSLFSMLGTGKLKATAINYTPKLTYSYDGNYNNTYLDDFTITNMANLNFTYECTGTFSPFCQCLTQSGIFISELQLYWSTALPCLYRNVGRTPSFLLC